LAVAQKPNSDLIDATLGDKEMSLKNTALRKSPLSFGGTSISSGITTSVAAKTPLIWMPCHPVST
jgi:hypothetical protein